MDTPSMVQRSGDKLIIRSVVSGNQLYPNQQSEGGANDPKKNRNIELSATEEVANNNNNLNQINSTEKNIRQQENDLPQCKIKRNYSCNSCSFFTQNPRRYLIHLRDLHGEKIVINECKKCLYASRHYQKLVRHMKMVHGTTEGINELSQSRKRSLHNNSSSSTSQNNKEFSTNLIKRPNINVSSIQEQLLLQQFGGSVPSELLGEDFELLEVGHNNNKLLKCPVCEFSTLEHSQLLDHEKQEHSKVKFYRCVKCNYVTHIKTRFSKHVKYHSMPMIKCIICDFRTPYKWNLDRHMKNHGGTGQFKCTVCNFTADIKQSLTVHELNHHVPPLSNGASVSGLGTNLCTTNPFDMSTDEQNINLNAFDMFQNKKYLEMMINEANAFKQNWLLQNAAAAAAAISGNQDALNLDTKNNPTRKARPIPNLIPIQNMAPPLLNLSKTKSEDDDDCDDVDEEDDEAGADEELELIEPTTAEDFSKQAITSSFIGLHRKNLSFFDKLKDKLAASSSSGSADHISFACKCGYNPKSLSDSIMHQRSCSLNENEDKEEDFDEDPDDDEEGALSINTNNMPNVSSSTRCQYCRHRCKSSIDLLTHLQTCFEAQKYYLEHKHKLDEMAAAAAGIAQSFSKQPHPMENKIFVWNNPAMTDEDDDDKDDSTAASAGNSEKPGNDDEFSNSTNDVNYFGIETAPGYGEVTQELNTQQVAPSTVSMKKVYKCPHCSFWASTASRFHVHIVGHLNKKPFECSLCAYRSNWRWDITKHIRLKTIRDSNHKTARVLMNDETGRRNYTKYNKYVTLMKVTDAESDDKKLKSGEMSQQNQAELEQHMQQHQQSVEQKMKATIEYSNQHPFDLSLKLNNSKPDSVPKLIKMPYNLFSNLSKESKMTSTAASQQPTISNFINEDFDASKDISSASSSPVNDSKKSHFKCKKCNFKDSNREVVLAHVKQHYHEAGLMANNQFLKTTLTESLIAAALQQQKSSASVLMTTATPPATMTATVAQSPMITATTNKQSVNAKRENGETNNETNSHQRRGVWRGPAPYRCGLCHQVSNWKHVIQRHCRLKHNGIILIESNNTTPSTSNSKEHQPSTSSMALSQILNNSTADLSNKISNHHHIATATTNANNPTLQATSNIVQMKPMATSVTPTPSSSSIINQSNTSGLNSFLNKKKHQCSLCPYVTESKAQLLYHKSFHKPKGDPFQCNWCSYNVAKKHLLNQHKKMHQAQAEAAGKSSPAKVEMVAPAAIDLTTSVTPQPASTAYSGHQDSSTMADKQLFFCSLCPARYLSMKEIIFHKQMHFANLPNKCEICTYTSTAATSVHLTVHTFYYLEKTREFQSKYKTNDQYSQPNLTMISMNNELYYITTPYVEIDKMNHDEDEDEDEAAEFEEEAAAPKENSEKCPHCPFYSCSMSLKEHLQHHKCISGKVARHECEHCDFSHDNEDQLNSHKKLHFLFLNNNNNNNNNNNAQTKGESLHYYTQYDNIEIKIEKKDGESKKGETGGDDEDEDTTIYKENNNNSDSFYYKFLENEKIKMSEKIILSIP